MWAAAAAAAAAECPAGYAAAADGACANINECTPHARADACDADAFVCSAACAQLAPNATRTVPPRQPVFASVPASGDLAAHLAAADGTPVATVSREREREREREKKWARQRFRLTRGKDEEHK